MALLPIVIYPHPTLKKRATEVEAFDGNLAKLLDDMSETMYAAGGIGIAANQVDSLQRVTVIDAAPDGEPAQLIEFVNPVIVEKSGAVTWHEGCLSLPELFGDVKRASNVKVSYRDRNGGQHELEAEGLLAVALQHEIDHLDGVMFIDRLSLLERKAALRRWQKIVEKREAEGR
jgi:peptide deformylase